MKRHAKQSPIRSHPTKENKRQRRTLSASPLERSNVLSSTALSHLNESDEDDGSQKSSYYDSYATFLKCFSLNSEDEDDDQQKSRKELVVDKHASFSNISDLEVKKLPDSILKQSDDLNKGSSESDTEDISFLSIPQKQLEILSLGPDSSITLHGYVNVHVQMGTVSIFGKKVKQGENVQVFSTEGTGLKRVLYFKSSRKSSVSKIVRQLINRVGERFESDIKEFAENIDEKSVVLLVKRCALPTNLQFLQLYIPHVLNSAWKNKVKEVNKVHSDEMVPMCSSEKKHVVEVREEYKKIYDIIDTEVAKSESTSSSQRILINGPRCCGKSTLLRYLINCVLNTRSTVYYLDTDPGQTEFTPPGVVSLIKITEPLLEPPFCHQKKPIKMIFTGSTTVSSPAMHLKGIQSLLNLFNCKFPGEMLFINTMGWIHGIGALCNEDIANAVNPTIRIIFKEKDCNSFSQETVDGRIELTVPSKRLILRHQNILSYITRPDWRNAALLSYLGSNLKPYMPAEYLNAIRPVKVCWDDVAISVMGKKVVPSRLVEAMQASVVALCYVHRSFMLESAERAFPKTLCEDPMNECLGFGFVRAADEVNHFLYIVTPLPLNELQKVNAIVKGNIVLPSVVFLKQPIENVDLPYTDHSLSKAAFIRRSIIKRPHKPNTSISS